MNVRWIKGHGVRSALVVRNPSEETMQFSRRVSGGKSIHDKQIPRSGIARERVRLWGPFSVSGVCLAAGDERANPKVPEETHTSAG